MVSAPKTLPDEPQCAQAMCGLAEDDAPTPKRLRGRAVLDPSLCLSCGMCSHVCAAGAIDLRCEPGGRGMEFRLWHNSCTFCGLCAHYCPTKALRMTTDWHLAHVQKDKFSLCETHAVAFPLCRECGKPMLPSLENRLPKEALGSGNASKLLETCPQCRRHMAARQQLGAIKPAIGQGRPS